MPHLCALALQAVRQSDKIIADCAWDMQLHMLSALFIMLITGDAPEMGYTPYTITALFLQSTRLCMSLHSLHHTGACVQDQCKV